MTVRAGRRVDSLAGRLATTRTSSSLDNRGRWEVLRLLRRRRCRNRLRRFRRARRLLRLRRMVGVPWRPRLWPSMGLRMVRGWANRSRECRWRCRWKRLRRGVVESFTRRTCPRRKFRVVVLVLVDRRQFPSRRNHR
uniref:(northern house mosquito) hypothetical protein n=1 Tax=Culex pipiens TaxID=7175 RepID=A0A8D8LAX5_CULPI